METNNTNCEKRIALIPAYMPDERLVELVDELERKGFSAVVVDDGSGEKYDSIFEACSFHAAVLAHRENKGKGAALKTGLRFISRSFEAPYTVVTLDADGQHSIKDAMRVCEAAERCLSALVLGCRSFRSEDVKVPKKSLLGNKLTRTVFRLSSGVDVSDTQTGLRAFSDRHVSRMCGISGDRYEYEMNVLMEYARQELPIREVPIETIYIDKNSSSHFRPVGDSARIYREILKFSASSLLCFVLDYLLYCLFSHLTGSVTAANIIARIFSAAVNFELNRRLVFGSKKSAGKSAAQYFALALFILACNTLMLNLLVRSVHIGRYAAKLITESAMFFVSYAVQRSFIFSRKKEGKAG
ncbi:MAG: bifunctional glycosyltransferase family 2/GtrA family protein [Ruminococcus sp.]|nr:bifunctional glycosyltransferase family 2/GtrA family protein [Ruminococcus sp.]